MDGQQSTVNWLFRNHIWPAIRPTYSISIQAFQRSCARDSLSSNTVTIASILRFIAHFYIRKSAISTVRVYLAAIGNFLLKKDLPSIVACGKIAHCLKDILPPLLISDKRLPLTLSHLRIIKLRLSQLSILFCEQELYSCAIIFALFGYLRVSKFTILLPTSFMPHTFLLLSNVTDYKSHTVINSPLENRSIWTWILDHVWKTGRSVGAVWAFEPFWCLRRTIDSSTGPVFIFTSYSFLTKSSVISYSEDYCAAYQIPPTTGAIVLVSGRWLQQHKTKFAPKVSKDPDDRERTASESLSGSKSKYLD